MTFTTDSELLETEYLSNFNIKVITLCIPHIIDFNIKPVKNLNEIVIGIIGPSRNYKGVIEALEALLIIDKADISKKNNITLILHSFGELSAQVNLMAEKFTTINVIVRRRPLSSDDYNNDIRLCDLILLNYDPAMYQRNTSGIFFEAICLGKDVITTENTWMAYQNSK